MIQVKPEKLTLFLKYVYLGSTESLLCFEVRLCPLRLVQQLPAVVIPASHLKGNLWSKETYRHQCGCGAVPTHYAIHTIELLKPTSTCFSFNIVGIFPTYMKMEDFHFILQLGRANGLNQQTIVNWVKKGLMYDSL